MPDWLHDSFQKDHEVRLVPLLIQLAQKSPNPAVRKEAVSALGRSNDPKAVAYLESLLR